MGTDRAPPATKLMIPAFLVLRQDLEVSHALRAWYAPTIALLCVDRRSPTGYVPGLAVSPVQSTRGGEPGLASLKSRR